MNNYNDIQTSERLLLSALSSAVLIEQQYGQFLLPAPLGVYKQGEVDPCLYNSEIYYYQEENADFFTDKGVLIKGGNCIQPVEDINKVNTDVYDKTGKVVIPGFMMQDKQNYLSASPTVPYRGVILTELLIKNYLDSISNIPGKKSYAGRIERHVLSDFLRNEVIESLEIICKSLFLQIEQFVGDDLWHIYYVKRIQFDVMIEKTIDYRIHFYNSHHNRVKSEDDDSS